jgi:hypothetical protein
VTTDDATEDDAVDCGRRARRGGRDRESGRDPTGARERVGQLRVDRTVTTAGDAALVAVTVWNPTRVDRTVAVESRLDGAVSPPRVDGVPAPGYRRGIERGTGGGDLPAGTAAPVAGEADGGGHRDGYRGTVPAGERVSVGFAVEGAATAVPADGSESGAAAVRVSDEGRADGTADGGATVADARRTLGGPRPPRATVPIPTPTTDPDATPSAPPEVDGAGRDGPPASRREPTGAASGWVWQTPARLVDPDHRGETPSEPAVADRDGVVADTAPGRSDRDRPSTRRRS